MKNKALLVCFLLIIATGPRLWKLTAYPPVIVDEPANIRDIAIIQAGNSQGPADFEWGYDKGMLVHYPSVMLMALGVKDDFLAIRLTSVILSILALIAFFGIASFYVDWRVSYLTTMLLASSYFFLQFSRVGWTNMLMIATGLWYLLSVMRLVNKLSIIRMLFTSILGGILLYTYRAGEIYFAAGLLLGIHKMKSVLLSFVIACFIALPWIIQATTHWDKFTMRQRAVSVQQIDATQIATTIRAWIFMVPTDGGGTENSRYLPLTYPPINYLLIPLYLIGLILLLKSWRNMFAWIFIFAVSFIGGQVFAVDPPNGARALPFLPVIYLAIAKTLDEIQKKYTSSSFIFTVLTVFVGVVAISDILFYAYWMSWISMR